MSDTVLENGQRVEFTSSKREEEVISILIGRGRGMADVCRQHTEAISSSIR